MCTGMSEVDFFLTVFGQESKLKNREDWKVKLKNKIKKKEVRAYGKEKFGLGKHRIFLSSDR